MNEQKNKLSIPAAIVLAGFLIAVGIYISDRKNAPATTQPTPTVAAITFKPISKDDHILGNPDAPITIVEFSDTECPFCKSFETTMQGLMSTYGKNGQVAWVYRHFPLDSIHPKTRKEAEATECANELGGNTIFWKYIDTIYSNTPSNNGLDASKLPDFANAVGLDVTKFNTCLASGKYTAKVEAQFQDGLTAGAQGTPYSVMVLKNALTDDKKNSLTDLITKSGLSGNIIVSDDGKNIILNGAIPATYVTPIIDVILK